MPRLKLNQRQSIIALRKRGHSIPEISRSLGIAKTTVQRHVQGVEIPQEYLQALKEKQGGSKERAAGLRANVASEVQALFGQKLQQRDLLMLLIGLYWGEGTKRDFGIINSDPSLIQAFIACLYSLGIPRDRLSLSLRLHQDVPVIPARKFWAETTGLAEDSIGNIEIIEGKKKGKLKYGMCRIRVRRGIRERLVIQTAISLIGKECANKLPSAYAPVV